VAVTTAANEGVPADQARLAARGGGAGLDGEGPRLTALVGAGAREGRRGPGPADGHALLDLQLPGTNEDAIDDPRDDFAALVIVQSDPATLKLGRRRQRVDRVGVSHGGDVQPGRAYALAARSDPGDIRLLTQLVENAVAVTVARQRYRSVLRTPHAGVGRHHAGA
jgi:hypothetical protein